MWLLLACSSSPPPAAVAPSPEWTLRGRATSAGLALPSLAGGTALLGPSCSTINKRLHGDGPPCAVEEWVADRVLLVERAGRKLRFDGKRGRTTWRQLTAPLPGCLGDPLSLPPADDAGATRQLLDGRWYVRFSGQNLCHLGGALVLDATHDAADWSGLTASGNAWTEGGLEAAWADLRASLRARIAVEWPTMDVVAREKARAALQQDPHPDAARLLDGLDDR